MQINFVLNIYTSQGFWENGFTDYLSKNKFLVQDH